LTHSSDSAHNPVNERNREWLLKNSFQGISPTKFVRKLLNVRSPWALKFTETTALVPFSSATGIYASDRVVGATAILRQQSRLFVPAAWQFTP
jgi:hypothetical protein